jgi:Cu/Ag efflux protein CusF
MDEISAIKPLTLSGNSVVINVTKEVKMLNLEHGDRVEIVIKRVKE